jgi:uncharacterized hydrophobic protein (TIGR00271 family)
MSHDDTVVGEVRYSRDMRLFRAITLGLGVSLGVGVFLLLGPTAQWVGMREPLVYIMASALFLPIALSLAELAAVSGPGGSYHLIRGSDRELLAYLTGWALLGGGIVLSGLLAHGSAHYLSILADSLFGLSLAPHWLILAIILFVTGNNILGSRENRWWQNAIVVIGLITLLIFSGWAWFNPPIDAPLREQPFHANPTAAIALLSAGLWGLMLILDASEEMRYVQKDAPRALLATLVLGSISGAVVAAAVLRVMGPTETQSLSIINLAAQLGGLNAQGWALTMGVILLVATLNRALLTTAHIAADMSREGFLPQPWRATHPQFQTPYWLLAGGGLLAALVSLYGDVTLLAALASFTLLSAVVLINIPTILFGANRLPEKRPIVLPFSPLIPGVAIAISLFLLTRLPIYAFVIGAAWFLMGANFYVFYARRGIVAARTGVTVFREKTELHAEAEYRVLVTIANPATAEALIGAASALALARNGDVLALQVVVVPDQTSLLAGRRAARQRWSLLDRAVKRAQEQEVGVPVHATVRIAHSAVEGILDTAHEENCHLILMGWRGEPTSMTYDLGPVIDQVIIQAPCDVAILKGEIPDKLECILVPTAGGPHAPAAVQIGLDLAFESNAEVIALNLIRGHVTAAARQQAKANIDQTLADIEDANRVSRRIARADDVKQGILDAASRCDLLLLGMSEEGMLDQIKLGGLPEETARASPQPVILVRRHRGLPQFWLRRLWRGIYAIFPSLDRPRQIEVYRTLRRDARPDVDFFVLIVLSSVIATLGLLQNSAAVIIGAMLVAPLMTPILGLSMGVVRGDVRLLRLALESALKGITLAVVVAVGVVLLVPHPLVTTEIAARTHPTLLDLIVALASGAAGAYAIGRKEVAAALPGVAIAAALVPPLCVVGIGIAIARSDVTGGAVLLFVTNLIAISLAGAIVFLLLGFYPTPDEKERQRRLWQGLGVSVALLLVISVPLGLFLVETVRDGQRQQVVRQVLAQEVPALNAVLVETDIQSEANGFHVVVTLYAPEPPDQDTVKGIQNKLTRAVGEPVRLELVVVPVARVPAE